MIFFENVKHSRDIHFQHLRGVSSVENIHRKRDKKRLPKNAVLHLILNLAHELVKSQTQVQVTLHFLSLFDSVFDGYFLWMRHPFKVLKSNYKTSGFFKNMYLGP